MKVFGQLESAALENLAADPTVAIQGRFYINTATNNVMVDDGTNKRAVLQNNGRAVFGTDTTANNNIRFHHAGQGLLQFVLGGDTTAENTPSTTLAMIGLRLSNLAAVPATGNIGRMFYNSTLNTVQFEGSAGFIQVATLTGTETLTNKTLTAPAMTTPSWDIATVTDQTAQPATPASGKTLVYTKNGFVYKMGSDGLETLVGSSAGGAKNYVTNGNFESNKTTGWTLGTTGTLTNGLPTGTPTFGSGAAAALTFVNTSTPLAGTYSAQLVSTAATTAGNMVATAMTLDPEDRAKVLSFKLSYQQITGTANFSGTLSNSYAVGIWDATNSVWLGVAGAFNFVQGTGVGIATGTFQTNLTTAQLYFCLYFPTATAGATTLTIDSVSVGPQTQSYGANVGNWQTYTLSIGATTTAPTIGTTSVNSAMWRRNGDSVEIAYTFLQSAAGSNAGSGQYLFPLPPGLVADLTKVSVSTNGSGGGGTLLGSAVIGTTTSASSNYANGGFAVLYNSTNLSLFAPGSAYNNTSAANSTSFATTNTNAFYSFNVKIPIVGWGAVSVQSSDTDTRVISAQLTSSSVAATSTADTALTATVDRAGGWTGTQYKVQVAGDYEAAGTVLASAAGTVQVYKNGNFIGYFSSATGASNASSGFVPLYGCVPGDYFSFRNSTSATWTQVVLSIKRLSGPAVVTAVESVNARLLNSTGASLATGTTTQITGWVKDYDSHGQVSTTGYSIPVTGKYSINWAAQLNNLSAGGVNLTLYVYKNGAVVSQQLVVEAVATSADNVGGTLVDRLQFVQGDVLTFYASQANGTTRSFSTTAILNRILISRDGN